MGWAGHAPSNRAECRECHQTILWVTMSYGKSRSLDPQPHERGEVLVYFSDETDDKGRRIRIGTKLDEETCKLARRAGAPLYRFHFQTCPNNRTRELANR